MKKDIVFVGVCALITFLVFLPTIQNGFVNWDDPLFLLENPLVRSLAPDNIQKIFTTHVQNLYVPLTIFSYGIEYHFAQYNPFLYHWDNLFLHIGTVILAFVFLRRCGLSSLGAFLATLLFAVHPLRVESVAWITARKDALSAFFYLAALCVYARYARGGRIGYFIAALALSVLSQLAKPIAFTLPLVFLLYDGFSGRRGLRIFIEKVYFFILLAPITMVTYAWHARPPQSDLNQGFLIWNWCFGFYLQKFVYPSPMVLLYDLPQPVSWASGAYFGAVALTVLFFAALFLFRKNRQVVFGLGFYLATLFFLLRFDTKVDFHMVADRYIYIPSLGLCFIAGYLVEKLIARLRKMALARIFVGVAVAAFLLNFAVISYRQTKVWKNGVELWENQLVARPQAARSLALYKLAESYSQEPQFAAAMSVLKRTGQPQPFVLKVIDIYQQAIKIKPDFAQAYRQLAAIYRALGDESKAVSYDKQATRIENNR